MIWNSTQDFLSWNILWARGIHQKVAKTVTVKLSLSVLVRGSFCKIDQLLDWISLEVRKDDIKKLDQQLPFQNTGMLVNKFYVLGGYYDFIEENNLKLTTYIQPPVI